jgi:hypothetical protein
MEQTQNTSAVIKQPKDHWRSAYKNFLHVFYFWIFLAVCSIVIYFMKIAEIQKLTLVDHLQFVAFGAAWFIISQQFKKHTKSAITISYTLIGIMLLWNIVSNGFNIIVLLIYGYFLYLVYRASKTKVSTTV